ncbi:MAG: hypothetical protein NT062_17090 [Proteobacteria bacterium]|nr:hypothetical protein [Pseudomonadota bacterium]
MRIALTLVLLAACSSPTPRPTTAQPPKRVPPDAGVPAVAPVVTPRGVTTTAIVKKFPLRPMIESPHAGVIKLVAVTADGTAALSVDDIDGLRLWPKLDGSVEPRVVELVHPKALALGRLGDGFLAVVVDDVGGLVIATLDPDGRTRQRATIAPDPGYLGAVIVDGRVLAWRADQIVVLLDPDGAVRAQLATEPGERVTTLLTTDTKVVAIVETANDTTVRHRPRPLVVGATLTWGPRIELAGDLGTLVALSPSGKRLGALVTDKAKTTVQLLVWDLASQKPIAHQVIRFATNLAFVDEEHVSLIQPAAFEWADLTAAKPPDPALEFEPFTNPIRASFGVGGGHVIAPRNDELAVATPRETKYLGYGLESPQVAAVGTGGQLLVGLGESFALLDRELHEVAAPSALVPSQSTIAGVHWLEGTRWLVETSGLGDGKTAIAIVDIAANTRKELRAGLPVAPLVMYEPETKLVTFSLGDAPEIARWNPTKLALDKLVTLAKPNGFEQRELIPIAPSLAGGTQLLSVQMRDRTTLRWASSPTTVDSGPSVIVDGSLAGSDRAGHAFVWQNGADQKLTLAVYAQGKQLGTLPTEGTTTVWPDPKGTRVVLLTSRGVSLVDLDGKPQWQLAISGTTEAHWLDDGTLALISAGGLARVDPARGEITATRCGWRFGLSPTPHPFTSRIEPVCVQPH